MTWRRFFSRYLRPFDVDHFTVVQETVENRGGENLVSEDLAPYHFEMTWNTSAPLRSNSWSTSWAWPLKAVFWCSLTGSGSGRYRSRSFSSTDRRSHPANARPPRGTFAATDDATAGHVAPHRPDRRPVHSARATAFRHRGRGHPCPGRSGVHRVRGSGRGRSGRGGDGAVVPQCCARTLPGGQAVAGSAEGRIRRLHPGERRTPAQRRHPARQRQVRRRRVPVRGKRYSPAGSG